ncbi:unnamed protein product [Rhizophagus irregularis]|nr:unnamed protein product [Rhizophagus irregularis]
MTKARKSPKPAKASKPAKTNVSNETQAAKGCGRGGRGQGRAKAVTEPIKPVKPIEHVPNASGGGGRGHSRVKAVTKPIKPVELEHAPIASGGGGRGRNAVTKPIEPVEPEYAPIASGGSGRGRNAVTKPIKPVEPEHAPIASGGGGYGHDRDRGCGKTNKPVESDVSHSGKSSPNVITVHDDDPIYDDPPDNFSASELPERLQFGRNDHFTLDYSAILDESNEDNYELETAGVFTNNIYDHSESSDEAEDGKDRKTEVSMSRGVKNVKKYMPKALNGMENILEVCQWLIMERQDILFMANQMYNASNASLDSPLVNMPTSPLTMKPAAITPNDKKDLARLWHEEIKCLFLRCRVPPDEVIERLVTKIFNYDLYSSDAEEVICHSKRVLTDFCSKLNKKIDARVSEFKEK